MRNLIQFLVRYSNFLIFLMLEVVAFILIGTCNDYQQSAMWSSANRIVAGTNNIKTSIVDYFSLRADNAELAEENARLKAELVMLKNNMITESDYNKCRKKLAQKYGISLCSIFA